jgi:uncharacterized membrane protein
MKVVCRALVLWAIINIGYVFASLYQTAFNTP